MSVAGKGSWTRISIGLHNWSRLRTWWLGKFCGTHQQCPDEKRPRDTRRRHHVTSAPTGSKQTRVFGQVHSISLASRRRLPNSPSATNSITCGRARRAARARDADSRRRRFARFAPARRVPGSDFLQLICTVARVSGRASAVFAVPRYTGQINVLRYSALQSSPKRQQSPSNRSSCAGQRLFKKRFLTLTLDREFEFYEFFSFLKFNEFYEFFFGWKNSQTIRNFANHRRLTCFDVLECNVRYKAFIRTTDHCKVQIAFVSFFYIFIKMKPWNASNLALHSGI